MFVFGHLRLHATLCLRYEYTTTLVKVLREGGAYAHAHTGCWRQSDRVGVVGVTRGYILVADTRQAVETCITLTHSLN